MGWEEFKLAVEYDGEQHRVDPGRYAYDLLRSEDLERLGWTRVRVVKANRTSDVLHRIERAWQSRLRADRSSA
jgi:very-short-patch-repair endonuclease